MPRMHTSPLRAPSLVELKKQIHQVVDLLQMHGQLPGDICQILKLNGTGDQKVS